VATSPHPRPPRIKLETVAYIRVQPENGGIVVDVSEGGLGFQLANPVPSGAVHFIFSLRDRREFEGTGTVVWTDATRKKGGLRFISLPQQAREELLLIAGRSAEQPAAAQTAVMTQPAAPMFAAASAGAAPGARADSLPPPDPDARTPSRPVPLRGFTSLARPYPVSPSSSEPRPSNQTLNDTPDQMPSAQEHATQVDEAPPNPPSAVPPLPSYAAPPNAPPSYGASSYAVGPARSAQPPARPEPAMLFQQYRSAPLDYAAPRSGGKVAVFLLGLVAGILLAALAAFAISRHMYPDAGEPIVAAITSVFQQPPQSPAEPQPAAATTSSAAPSPDAATSAAAAEPPVQPTPESPAPAATPPALPAARSLADEEAGSAPAQATPLVPAVAVPASKAPVDGAATARGNEAGKASGETTSPDGGAQDLQAALQYLRGTGRSKDSAAAAVLLWRAVENGNTTAEMMLAQLYLDGNGVEKSCEQARVLLTAAAQKGSADAAQMLEEIAAGRCR
jgi:hypothetical protein